MEPDNIGRITKELYDLSEREDLTNEIRVRTRDWANRLSQIQINILVQLNKLED